MKKSLIIGQLLAVCLLASAAAWGQAGTNGTGVLAGTVKDSSGAPMANVAVEAASPALIEKVRDAVTGDDGLYRIVNLPPGAYTVTFTLTGFNTFKREGINITVGFTSTVDGNMTPGSVQQTITVSGESPVLDTEDSVVQKVLENTTFAALPVGSSASVYPSLLPGAVAAAGNQDVGGIRGEEYQGFRMHGSASGDYQQLRDGMFWGTLVAPGSLMSSANQTSIQEIQIESSGYTAEDWTDAGHVNLIPRGGGNDVHGSFQGDFSAPQLESSNLDATLKGLGVPNPPGLKKLYEIAGGVGGAIIKDKLWFYADARYWTSQATNAGSTAFFDANELAPFPNNLYYASNGVQDYLLDYYTDAGLRLTWQASKRNKFTINYIGERNCNCYFNITGGTTAAEATGNDAYKPNWRFQASWEMPVNNKLLLWAGFTSVVGTVDRSGTGSTPANVSVTDTSANSFIYGAAGTGVGFTTSYGIMDFANFNSNVTASYVTGAHAFKFGFTELTGRGFRNAAFNNNGIGYQFACKAIDTSTANIDANNGLPLVNYHLISSAGVAGATTYTSPIGAGVGQVAAATVNTLLCPATTIAGTAYNNALLPNTIAQFLDPYSYKEAIESHAMFGQDQWRIKRLTLNLGLRFDWFTSGDQAQGFGANTQYGLPAQSFPAEHDVTDWKDLDPRFGAAYDLFGNGKTAIKASLSRAVLFEPLGGYTSLTNPAQELANNTTRSWTDTSGDFLPQCTGVAGVTGVSNPAANGECGAISNPLFGTHVPTYGYANDVTHGWQNRTFNWQMTLSVQQEIAKGVALSFGYYRTWYGNLAVAQNTSLPLGPNGIALASDYNQYCVTPPLNTSYNVGGQPLCNLYDVAAADKADVTYQVRKASDFSCAATNNNPGCGNLSDVYTGIDALVNARFHGILLQGGLTTGHEVTNYCVEVNSPEDLYYTANPTPLPTSVLEFSNQNFGTANDAAPCKIAAPWQQNLQFKLAGVYTIPKVLIQFSANEQNLPSIPTQASYTYSSSTGACATAASTACFTFTNPAITTLSGDPATNYKVEVVTPQTLFQHGRNNQTDIRFARTFTIHERWKIQPTFDLYNIFNANSILATTTGFNASAAGAAGAWRNVTQILPGRLAKFGVHVDF